MTDQARKIAAECLSEARRSAFNLPQRRTIPGARRAIYAKAASAALRRACRESAREDVILDAHDYLRERVA